METPLTMAMLILAVSLIMAGSAFLIRDEGKEDNDEIRYIQARELGISIINMIEESYPLLDPSSDQGPPSIYIREGNDTIRHGPGMELDGIIRKALNWSPEQDWCMVIVGGPDHTAGYDSEGTVVWKWDLSHDSMISVTLPIDRSVTIPEVFTE